MIYIFSKLFTYLFLPPGIFIILLFLAFFYAKKFKILFLISALSFYLLSNSYVADSLMSPLETPYNHPFKSVKRVDAVVALGGGSMAGSANLPLASDAFKRAVYALMIAKSQNLPLLFSGGSLDKNFTESKAFLNSMKELTKDLGVTLDMGAHLVSERFSLHVEDKSLDTFQNAKFSKKLLERSKINHPTIYLVTSAYHMERAKRVFEYFGFKVYPRATDFKIDHRAKTLWDYLPNMMSFQESYLAIHEYAGLLSLKLRGI